jgi:tRNA (guanine-N7-)-methyltransferase
MPPVRVRQHVNPLSHKYQRPIEVPQWDSIYSNLSRPLHLDIGCGRGKFLQQLAPLQPDWNFLGLEIREPLTIEANSLRDRDRLTNLHYLFCNVNLALAPLLETLPSGCLQRVTIQFPDPWFKQRHQKRRVVQSSVVDTVAHYLIRQGEVFLQSDVESVACEMCDRFAASPLFDRTDSDWLPHNPMLVPTERELGTLQKGQPVYRALFIRR